jgi:hypothetical protein
MCPNFLKFEAKRFRQRLSCAADVCLMFAFIAAGTKRENPAWPFLSRPRAPKVQDGAMEERQVDSCPSSECSTPAGWRQLSGIPRRTH